MYLLLGSFLLRWGIKLLIIAIFFLHLIEINAFAWADDNATDFESYKAEVGMGRHKPTRAKGTFWCELLRE